MKQNKVIIAAIIAAVIVIAAVGAYLVLKDDSHKDSGIVGEWKAVWFYGMDANGNEYILDQSELLGVNIKSESGGLVVAETEIDTHVGTYDGKILMLKGHYYDDVIMFFGVQVDKNTIVSIELYNNTEDMNECIVAVSCYTKDGTIPKLSFDDLRFNGQECREAYSFNSSGEIEYTNMKPFTITQNNAFFQGTFYDDYTVYGVKVPTIAKSLFDFDIYMIDNRGCFLGGMTSGNNVDIFSLFDYNSEGNNSITYYASFGDKAVASISRDVIGAWTPHGMRTIDEAGIITTDRNYPLTVTKTSSNKMLGLCNIMNEEHEVRTTGVSIAFDVGDKTIVYFSLKSDADLFNMCRLEINKDGSAKGVSNYIKYSSKTAFACIGEFTKPSYLGEWKAVWSYGMAANGEEVIVEDPSELFDIRMLSDSNGLILAETDSGKLVGTLDGNRLILKANYSYIKQTILLFGGLVDNNTIVLIEMYDGWGLIAVTCLTKDGSVPKLSFDDLKFNGQECREAYSFSSSGEIEYTDMKPFNITQNNALFQGTFYDDYNVYGVKVPTIAKSLFDFDIYMTDNRGCFLGGMTSGNNVDIFSLFDLNSAGNNTVTYYASFGDKAVASVSKDIKGSWVPKDVRRIDETGSITAGKTYPKVVTGISSNKMLGTSCIKDYSGSIVESGVVIAFDSGDKTIVFMSFTNTKDPFDMCRIEINKDGTATGYGSYTDSEKIISAANIGAFTKS